MRKIRKGDQVVIRSGKDRGKRGAVLRLVGDDLVVVEGANRARKHEKPNPMKGTTGGIVEKEMPIHVSNVSVFNPATQKGERVSIKTLDDGRKVRVFRTNGEMLDA
ncbi:MAG: 50S ribosomal protein L24 [Betaproteobacteria bacterium SG8_40]|nr:MAG: 50S ribosomal protein L24 [Betaproteobacteria bacterium SG8_40]